MQIIFNGALCPIRYFHIGVQGNNLVDNIEFVVDRYTPDGLDLTTFMPYVKLANDKQGYADKDGKLKVEPSATKIHLTYQLRRKTTAYASVDVQLQFERSGEADVAVWQTEAITITLSHTIPADAEIVNQNPAVIQDLTARVEKIENIKIINGGKP